ncbi:hypothetical protein [Umezawaea beigongshangensis]|uniref:hypothetical protein n=1 Tax=Umezawaea beigongshangensis TaxID=2780383 RepID=UPI0027DC98A9|nr:hypothetical protein [Umezawaea beigongshangensis]
MGIFRRKKPAPEPREIVRDHTYEDVVLDAAVEELADGHLKAATTVLAETRDQPELRQLRLEVLRDEAVGHADEILDTAQKHDDPDLWLLAGSAYIGEAWAVRGTGSAKAVGEDRFKVFFSTLRKAVEPLHRAARLLPGDAVPWSQLQTAGMGLQVSREQKDEVWREIISRCSTLYPAHWVRLQILAPKWGGSHEEMMAFAQGCVDKAEPGDPLVAMLALAHFEVYLERMSVAVEDRSAFAAARLKTTYFRRVRAELAAASDLWTRDPRPHPRTLQAHNLFAAAFALADDGPRAKAHLRGMRDHVHDIPWSFVAVLDEDIDDEYQKVAAKYLTP